MTDKRGDVLVSFGRIIAVTNGSCNFKISINTLCYNMKNARQMNIYINMTFTKYNLEEAQICMTSLKVNDRQWVPTVY